ncbi:prestin-like isoform X2 [Penaeus chinensis]|uniref:prestin-like isoform X2 n=1 Tax=Penaeus chinensis TaxID=139456 RepID=UPI001FB6B941|nr:prestin-like isoform X2 [Penaeus chinensis]
MPLQPIAPLDRLDVASSSMGMQEDTLDDETQQAFLSESGTTMMSSKNDGGGGGSPSGEMCVVRPTLNVAQRNQHYHFDPGHSPGLRETIQTKVAKSCSFSSGCVSSAITARLPILSWLPAYNFREHLLGDIIAGVTIAIMHIPQGMGFALLSNIPPVNGIYMGFFPVLIYALLGTSRHCSMGSFAVVCLMTGKVVTELATPEGAIVDGDIAGNSTTSYTAVQVATIVSFMVGVWELIMGLLQLGSLSVFLSEMLVSGFTTGAAFHVLTSQVKYLFGLQIKGHSGPFKIIYTYRDIIKQLLHSNVAAVIGSAITIIILTVNNEVIKPRLRKKTNIPIPIELIVVILGTAASYLGNLNEQFDLLIVGEIPTGLPQPEIPPFELIPKVVVDAFVITIVAYTVSYSMAKIFAKKHNYEVDAAQELYSQSASNVFGAFFGCGPIAASLARSLIQEAVGGVTQMTTVISCALLLLVLLFVGPVFETLPNCVLSSVIVVALKGMFMQVNDLRRVWAISRADAMIWLASFLAVVLIDIDFGLLIGVVVSLFVLLYRGQKPSTAILGSVPNTDIYLDINKYSAAAEVPSVSIFHFNGPLHFANSEYFRIQMFSMTGLDPSAIVSKKKALEKEQPKSDLIIDPTKENGVRGSTEKIPEEFEDKPSDMNDKHAVLSLPEVKWLVLDMSRISYLDSTGGKLIAQLGKEYDEAGIMLVLASVSESVLDSLEKCGTLKTITAERIFHTIHDAVTVLTVLDNDSNCTKL